MKNTYLKKIQKAVNHTVNLINKNVKNDNLWQGRFVMTQTKRYYYPYPDHSGYSFDVTVRVTDKVTGKFYDYYNIWVVYTSDGMSRLSAFKFWEAMNDFIVEKSGYWQERAKEK